MKCWICKRNKEQIEKEVIKSVKYIDVELCEMVEIMPEDNEDYEYFKKNKIYICGICFRVLNNYIDNWHE